ncbi:MAG: head GIN domain-containing protein [Bacteroidota bacterium]
MKSRFILGLLAITLSFASCENDSIRASGEVTAREFTLSGYRALEVGGAFDVFIRFSDTEQSIRIEANENLQDRLVVRMDGNTLKIKPEDNLNIKGNATLRAFITTNNLMDINLSGATTLSLENEWIVNEGSLRMSGASDLSGPVMATRLEVQASGSSDVDLFGTVEEFYANLSGSSDLKDLDLQVQRLDIDLSGSSDAFLSVNESIEIDASGSSSLTYRGNADILRQNLSGGSELNQRN